MGEDIMYGDRVLGGHFFKITRDILGTSLHIDPKIGKKKNTLVVMICIEMDISRGLLDVIMLEVGENHHCQDLYYKNVPFKCTLYKYLGHLNISLPYNVQDNSGDVSHTIVSHLSFGEEIIERSRKR